MVVSAFFTGSYICLEDSESEDTEERNDTAEEQQDFEDLVGVDAHPTSLSVSKLPDVPLLKMEVRNDVILWTEMACLQRKVGFGRLPHNHCVFLRSRRH